MNPTIGRIVHYLPRSGENGGRDKLWPAIITAVHVDGSVNLTVFRDLLSPIPVDHAKEGTEPGTWRWPERS